jgi:hypothetical protein
MGLHLKKLEAEEEPPEVTRTRRALFREIGEIQFPDVIVEIDTHTRFSWMLLGHEPKMHQELLTLYGAILADGTALNPSEIALMIEGISAQDIIDAMRLLEDTERSFARSMTWWSSSCYGMPLPNIGAMAPSSPPTR